MTRFAPLLLVLFALGAGCSKTGGTAVSVPPTTSPSSAAPVSLVLFDQLRPADTPPEKALLTLEGTKVPVTVKSQKKGHDFTIELYFSGELFDSERYVVTSDTFSLAEGAGEKYEPPIPLINFPFHLQQPPTKWSGTFSSMQDPHPAQATITMEMGEVPTGNTTIQAYQVEVALTLGSGANRKLVFWFAPGKGLVKRDFGASQREPAP